MGAMKTSRNVIMTRMISPATMLPKRRKVKLTSRMRWLTISSTPTKKSMGLRKRKNSLR